MSLLFDQNLSRRLVGLLETEYPGSEHVEGAGLLGADDLIAEPAVAADGSGIEGKNDFVGTETDPGRLTLPEGIPKRCTAQ